MKIQFIRSWSTPDKYYKEGDVANFHPITCNAFIGEGIAKAIDEPPRDKMMKKNMVRTK